MDVLYMYDLGYDDYFEYRDVWIGLRAHTQSNYLYIYLIFYARVCAVKLHLRSKSFYI